MLAVAHSAAAFGIRPVTSTVVEYYNAVSGHYFLTISYEEAVGLESGQAGPGWVRTGYTFEAISLGSVCWEYCARVARFYAPSARTHLLTADTAEVDALRWPGSGWNFEGYAFTIGAPDSSGQCAEFETPVYRLYNNRAAFNDVNHRFVTSADERERMRAKGWIDEGVKFCAPSARQVPIKSFEFDVRAGEGKILASSACEDESRNLGSCMALNNLTPPTTLRDYGNPQFDPQVYANVTGFLGLQDYIIGTGIDALAATNVFVQLFGNTYGVHVDTIQRGPSVYSSVNPLFQFKTTVDAGAPDTRVFPFSHAYETDAQISVKFIANVRTVKVRNSASVAYGHPTLEFIDQRSGHHVYFTTLVYSSQPFTNGDYLAPDVATGKVIVGTTFRGDSPYVRNIGSWTFSTPSGFTPENPWGRGGPFEYRMDRTEFARVLASARTVDPALSAAPEDYLLDNYHFNNEVYGDGEIGMNLGGFRLEIIRL